MALRRLVLLVSAIVLLDTVFYAVVAPLLPHYRDELGLDLPSAGILFAAYPAGTLLASLPSGVLTARLGPRRTVLVGLFLLGASSLAFGLARSVVVLDVARFVQGVGGACSWAGGLAWLVAAAPADRRGALIGTALGAAIAGSLLGPVAGALAQVTSPELVFTAIAAVAALLAGAALAEHAPAEREDQRLRDLPAALRRPGVALAMWLVALPAVAFGVLEVIAPLRLDDLGASGTAVGATFLVAAAVEGLISPLVGRMSDSRGRLAPIRLGLVAATVLLCVVTIPHVTVALAAGVVLTTGALGMFWAPAMAMLSDEGEAAGLTQGMAFALMNLAWAGGQVVGAAVGGPAAGATADAVPLAVAAALCAATFAATARTRVGARVATAP